MRRVPGLVAALAVAVVAVVTTGPALAVQVDALQPERDYRLAALRFVGAKAVPARTLRPLLLTKTRAWFALWRSHLPFDPVTFRTDLERIRRAYESRGYYNAVVEHDVELPERGDDVTAVVYVEEGEPVRVTQVDVTLAGEPLPAEEHEQLLANLPLKQGDVLTDDAYTRTETTLRGYYREHGYARVEVTRHAAVDGAQDTATVTYAATSGPPTVFGETQITGTQKITRGVLRRELAYDPGDPFRQSRLDRTRDRLVGLNLFRTVRLDEKPQPDNRVDIHVRVLEAPPREIRLGVGYDTEEQARGLAAWRSYNFLGGARQLGFTARVSLLRRTIAADFLQPHFPGNSNRTRLLFVEQQDDEDSYDLDRTRVSPRFEWQATDRITGFAFYRAEYDSLSNIPEGIRLYSERVNPDLIPSNSVVSGAGFGAEWNTTDDPLDPTRGFATSTTVEPVGGALSGGVSFLRVVGEGRAYQPLVGKLLGAARLRIGSAEPTAGDEEIPIFERFFAGGLNSVRGYERRHVGLLVAGPSTPGGPVKIGRGNPVGGRSVVEASVELRYPVTDRIAAAVFVDGGEVSQKSWKFRFGHLRYGAGPGALVRTPVGPLRIDLGFPVQPPPGDSHWQIHVSLGTAF